MTEVRNGLRRFASLYGMLGVLALLCGFFAAATYHAESPSGPAGADALAAQIEREAPRGATIVPAGPRDADGTEFAARLTAALAKAGFAVAPAVLGDPPEIRSQLEALASSGRPIGWIATTRDCAAWPLWDALKRANPAFAQSRVVSPSAVRRSTFLTPSNLRNIADQTAVIAIMAVGMTMVIITGGIDLSVGSLLALSAVLTAWTIQRLGGEHASAGGMLAACLSAIALCAAVGGASGWLTARFKVPPFIVTLAGMQIASGFAFIVARGQSIYDMPASFTWLGRGASLAGLPNAVVLMALVYIAAHLFMGRTAQGRQIYAVGGNAEASRLSGVPVRRTIVLVYIVSAAMAGVGGVITASQLKAGAPIYGVMYEMYVIAAVVVGGTSLAGGQGQVFGTLIGAFVIAVIRNGMNLMDVEPYTQKVLLGVVILGAVLVDILRRRARPPNSASAAAAHR
ncbi:MAG TPA: ABC transporter permease [Chthonomonadaceae bacterium]|nr:ABC transporter permease [Chthonomonadaceae bacterium]